MQIQEQVVLGPYTTLNIGGPARFFCHISSQTDLRDAIAFAREHRLRMFVLGGGSNLVVPDEGFDGLVLHLALGSQIDAQKTAAGTLLRVDAGVDWNAVVQQVCEQGISGVECLAGIPGLVGGSPIQNIGAYGQEVASTIRTVHVLDLETLQMVQLSHADCGFAYRHSIFNSSARGRYIVTRVDFFLPDGAQPNLTYADLASLRGTDPSPLDVYNFIRATRDRKGMLIEPGTDTPDSRSAGSFFKNPVVASSAVARIAQASNLDDAAVPHWPLPSGDVKLPAAWLIERAGFPKGFALGRVGISSRHTLALINRTGDATCEDLLRLRDLILAQVQERFDVKLEQEPIMLA